MPKDRKMQVCISHPNLKIKDKSPQSHLSLLSWYQWLAALSGWHPCLWQRLPSPLVDQPPPPPCTRRQPISPVTSVFCGWWTRLPTWLRSPAPASASPWWPSCLGSSSPCPPCSSWRKWRPIPTRVGGQPQSLSVWQSSYSGPYRRSRAHAACALVRRYRWRSSHHGWFV